GRGADFPPPEKPLPNAPAASVADSCGVTVPEVLSELSFETLEYRKEKKEDVLRSVNELMGLIESRADAEWGGVFDFADAAGASKRKILIESARAAKVLAEAAALTGSPERAASAAAAAEYAAVFLADPKGGFYFAQESALMGPDGEMSGEEFYKLPDSARRKIGMPARDKTMRVADNAAAAAALLRASDVLSRPAVETAALAAVERILSDAWSDDFGAARVIPPQGEKPDFSETRLADNALLARALIEAYQTTGETRFLDKAESAAAIIHKNFRRADAQEFSLYEAASSSGGGSTVCSSDSFSNLVVVSVLSDLYLLTDNEAYRARADALVATMKAMSSTDLFSALGRETLFRMEHKPLMMVVVGSKKDPATAAMRSSALKFFEPLKLVMTVDPELDAAILERLPYSARPKPTLFACVDTACSFPVDDPAETEPKMRVFVDRHMFAEPQPGKLAF
ncbi:MAG TPA: AGE family epimerase/isomerase, partial [bacterium]|nr:AGE family epimerase/isomerase [bacterium]